MTNKELIALMLPRFGDHLRLDITHDGYIRLIKPVWFNLGHIDECKVEAMNDGLKIINDHITVELYTDDWRAPFIHYFKYKTK